MKLFKKVRKGFTLIELVVVIAVIAILSAVAVVSYVTITKRAKTSSDQQAVAQMNTILAANDVLDLRTINDVYAAFQESELSIENYKPLMKDRYFFWDADANRIVYTDADFNVLYPEDMKGVTKDQHQWYSLTQSIEKASIENAKVDVNGVQTEVKNVHTENSTIHYDYAVSSPEQLYTVGQELKDAMLNATVGSTTQGENNEYAVYREKADSIVFIVGDFKLVLTQDLDLMGASFNFCIKGNFEIEGNGHTIKGIVNNKDFVQNASTTLDGTNQTEHYGTGLLGAIKGGTAKFNNVKFENCVFGYSDGKGAGLVGYLYNSAEFNNVEVKNCSFEAYEHSAGGFVADTQTGAKITLKGANSVKNSSIKLHESRENVSAANKECYGAGYFIGRQTNVSETVVTLEEGATFVQSGNSKKYGSKSTPTVPDNATKRNYRYWDDAIEANRKFVTE